MQYDAPLSEYDLVERSVRLADGLPWVAALVAEVRGQRATSKYWGQDYSALALPRDAGGAVMEQDPALLLVAANAGSARPVSKRPIPPSFSSSRTSSASTSTC